jgi:hypothetical protein
MATPRFPQRKDSDLLEWSSGFRDAIVADPGRFSVSAAQAAAYSELHDAFAARYAIANSPTGNSKAGIGAKNDARKRLLYSSGGAWELVKLIQAAPSTTDEMRNELGLRIRTKPVPVSAPRSAPKMMITSTIGRRVKMRLRDRDHPDNRGKPAGVRGATVLYCVDNPAEGPPEDVSQWMFAMNTSKPVFEVVIPSCVPAGSGVWLVAFWFNDKMQSGPMSLPRQVHIGAGTVSARADADADEEPLRLAA